MAKSKLTNVLAQANRRAIFKEIGLQLSTIYAPMPEQKLPQDMETILAKLQAKVR
jgi:hypothetical protein